MKVGCIGLGDIAQKAYLPVLGFQSGVDLHFQTHTPATLHRVADSLHVPQCRRHTDLDALLAQDLDAAFVHAPTVVQPEIVTRLLEAGVPTYVDKPLADCERLVRLAEERNVSLAVGFNRRYAPGYVQCADHPRELILMQKHRVGLPEEPRKMIFDDFVNPPGETPDPKPNGQQRTKRPLKERFVPAGLLHCSSGGGPLRVG